MPVTAPVAGLTVSRVTTLVNAPTGAPAAIAMVKFVVGVAPAGNVKPFCGPKYPLIVPPFAVEPVNGTVPNVLSGSW